ncbi:MAG TPA: EVE domain-containing protein [Polyangiales bacterium]|nr:EVE domain-containing protein [Polyangiales bacterium]
MASAKPSFWLMKTEPEAYSIDELASKGRGSWDGVRSFQARNHMRAMKVGDLVLFYHSSTEPPGVAGLARVCREAYPDHTQFDAKHDHYDPKSKRETPRWDMVDVEFVEKLPVYVTLAQLKSDPALAAMLVVKTGMRLSVQPVERTHFAHVLKLGRARLKLSARS